VFDPFFTTKPVGEGTGIGLSFCKDTIEQAGGTISIGSTPDVGTTVTLRLKIAPQPS
jgi:two-component system NtrC family sensor kinase